MSIFSRLNPFSRGPKSRPISERIGGYEPPAHAKPWEQDENGAGEIIASDHRLGRPVAEDPAHAGAPAGDGFEIRPRTEEPQEVTSAPLEEPEGSVAQPVYLDDFRSDDELPPGWRESRFG
jgi:hypothetical protein